MAVLGRVRLGHDLPSLSCGGWRGPPWQREQILNRNSGTTRTHVLYWAPPSRYVHLGCLHRDTASSDETLDDAGTCEPVRGAVARHGEDHHGASRFTSRGKAKQRGNPWSLFELSVLHRLYSGKHFIYIKTAIIPVLLSIHPLSVSSIRDPFHINHINFGRR